MQTIDEAISKLDKFRRALEEIESQYLPSMPASAAGGDVEWRDRHIAHLRHIAREALK